jgi:hypothetical protein
MIITCHFIPLFELFSASGAPETNKIKEGAYLRSANILVIDMHQQWCQSGELNQMPFVERQT